MRQLTGIPPLVSRRRATRHGGEHDGGLGGSGGRGGGGSGGERGGGLGGVGQNNGGSHSISSGAHNANAMGRERVPTTGFRTEDGGSEGSDSQYPWGPPPDQR